MYNKNKKIFWNIKPVMTILLLLLLPLLLPPLLIIIEFFVFYIVYFIHDCPPHMQILCVT